MTTTELPTAIEVADAERGSDRIFRSFACTIGLGGVVYGLMDSPEIIHQSHHYALWWTSLTFVLIFGTCLVLAAVSFKASVADIRLITSILAVNYLVVVALSPLALDYAALPAQSTWQYRIAALGAVSAGLAWRAVPATVYLFLAAAAAALVNMYALGESGGSALAQDFARALTTAGLFTWVAICADRAGSILDQETTRAKRAAAATAAAHARAVERDRFAALIHDGVLSTLLDASRGTAPSVLARQASFTLRQLDEFRTPPGRSGQLDALATIDFLREAVHQVNGKVGFEAHRQAGFDDLIMPIDAAHTVSAALTEAVRNSLRHGGVSGRTVARTVSVTLGAGGLRVEIADDGAGFDPNAVSNDRLGVAFSILGRMGQLPGGAAFVESQPGAGTKVTLVWGSRGDR
ncbi:sensor histidine kinase [Antrihabitans cavernicola]|uniref:ATP-binding protein n=1 Tax=Antrihabitans cavernicola TaxID=2495913 RepID=A0A5A7SD55_9NOCA|nr:ATP-binding protein [Spelaeibacter cavernicola]KAA0023309.1 ATP-binding protein [Spelaeibacter cavernicola]